MLAPVLRRPVLRRSIQLCRSGGTSAGTGISIGATSALPIRPPPLAGAALAGAGGGAGAGARDGAGAGGGGGGGPVLAAGRARQPAQQRAPRRERERRWGRGWPEVFSGRS